MNTITITIDTSHFTNQQLIDEMQKRGLDAGTLTNEKLVEEITNRCLNVFQFVGDEMLYDEVVERGIDIPPLEERKRTLLDEVKMDIVESGIHNKSLAELEAFFNG